MIKKLLVGMIFLTISGVLVVVAFKEVHTMLAAFLGGIFSVLTADTLWRFLKAKVTAAEGWLAFAFAQAVWCLLFHIAILLTAGETSTYAFSVLYILLILMVVCVVRLYVNWDINLAAIRRTTYAMMAILLGLIIRYSVICLNNLCSIESENVSLGGGILSLVGAVWLLTEYSTLKKSLHQN